MKLWLFIQLELNNLYDGAPLALSLDYWDYDTSLITINSLNDQS